MFVKARSENTSGLKLVDTKESGLLEADSEASVYGFCFAGIGAEENHKSANESDIVERLKVSGGC